MAKKNCHISQQTIANKAAVSHEQVQSIIADISYKTVHKTGSPHVEEMKQKGRDIW
jgi:exoribonuclease R